MGPMNQTGTVDILDVTLRDGGYANGFDFTVEQTKTICRALEAAGVGWIEVGHGAGMNAGNTPVFEEAAASDEEYLAAAADVCDEAKWGTFCFPALASSEDVELVAAYDADFLRIGCHVTEVERSKDLVETAKANDVFVSANMVKSAAVSPERFAEKVNIVEEYGADLVYIVDSAGGIVPPTLKTYEQAIRSVTDIPFGYHGHNNLGLAVANSLTMAEGDAALVDTSLQGFGRSAGNAPTETTVAALEKAGYDTGVDILKLLQAGHEYISPYREESEWDPLAVAGGYFDIHSEHFQTVLKHARDNDIDPVHLLRELSDHDKVHAPDELVHELARSLDSDVGGVAHEYGW